MNNKILLVLLNVAFNFYFDLNSVTSGSPRSPRPPIDIDAQDPNTSTFFDKTKEMETSSAKRRGPASNIDPSALSTPPQSPLKPSPHARPFGSLDEIIPGRSSVDDKPIDVITGQSSFSERMAERAKANKIAERLNLALEEGRKTKNNQDLPQRAIKEPPLSRDLYPEIIIPGESVKIETKVSEPLTPKENNINETEWWGSVVDSRGSSQIDKVRKLQQAALEQRIDQTPTSPLARNPSLSPMEEENVDKLSSLAGIPDLLRKKGKQSNLSVQTTQVGQEPQPSQNKNSSSKSKKKKTVPKQPVPPGDFKKNFGQAFLGKFNEEFELQGGPEYANALEIVRRMATKDQFAESTKSVIDARKRFNAANKAVLEQLSNPIYAEQINGFDKLRQKTKFSDQDTNTIYDLGVAYPRDVNQKYLTEIDQAKKVLDDAVKKETEAYLQEAKNAFIEASPGVEAMKKTETKLLAKAYAKMGVSGLSGESINNLLKKKSLDDDDRAFISDFLSDDDKATFDGINRARNESSIKLNNLLSFVPPESLDETKINTEISRNDTLGEVRGDFVLPQNQRKKAKVPVSPLSDSGLLKESSFKNESEALGDSYLELKATTPKTSQTLAPDSPTVESTKTNRSKSPNKKLSSPKKKTTSLEKQDNAEIWDEYARLAAEKKTSLNDK